MTDHDKAAEAARRIDAVLREIAGEPLPIAFRDDSTALKVGAIINNAGTVARAYLALADENHRLREALRGARNYIDGSRDDSGHRRWLLNIIDVALGARP